MLAPTQGREIRLRRLGGLVPGHFDGPIKDFTEVGGACAGPARRHRASEREGEPIPVFRLHAFEDFDLFRL